MLWFRKYVNYTMHAVTIAVSLGMQAIVKYFFLSKIIIKNTTLDWVKKKYLKIGPSPNLISSNINENSYVQMHWFMVLLRFYMVKVRPRRCIKKIICITLVMPSPLMIKMKIFPVNQQQHSNKQVLIIFNQKEYWKRVDAKPIQIHL